MPELLGHKNVITDPVGSTAPSVERGDIICFLSFAPFCLPIYQRVAVTLHFLTAKNDCPNLVFMLASALIMEVEINIQCILNLLIIYKIQIENKTKCDKTTAAAIFESNDDNKNTFRLSHCNFVSSSLRMFFNCH